ncbi:hypothetical protein CHUAL_004156 [Chamberlinius hualienensis]
MFSNILLDILMICENSKCEYDAEEQDENSTVTCPASPPHFCYKRRRLNGDIPSSELSFGCVEEETEGGENLTDGCVKTVENSNYYLTCFCQSNYCNVSVKFKLKIEMFIIACSILIFQIKMCVNYLSAY